ncbi:6,7-dimethyl-8-ribityllumazine synthase [Mangrovicoccus sp. HB161399]|uniref:6,7-dimethyl-8-ribityllumazine synthase n=1 Tax=Mangrovicoccus sp. HB161399 TaxID=2720392 RepID=UPI0015563E97|nr:6,7-dimethyl-8-ribityllumazine synthase [Mangrovicoccus sp. HB161399]
MSDRNSPRIGFIKASWHADIVDQALTGFSRAMPAAAIRVVTVPGAFELPLAARRMARTGRYDAIVCAAFVVNGGIYHNEFVSQAVVSGLMQVGLETDVPVLSVSLTPHNFQETDPMMRFFLDHFLMKGEEAAAAVTGILQAHDEIGGFGGQLDAGQAKLVS